MSKAISAEIVEAGCDVAKLESVSQSVAQTRAGAALASLVAVFLQMVWVSEYKGPTFGIAGFLSLGNGALQWHNRTAPCPTDPSLRHACVRVRRTSALM